ncbi:MAG: ABC transporter permease [Coriobacteriales bacterium]|jgi:putative ABC transport system permease protein|nr:ABC transporter permease [Coriobacteriales bacterium]
MGIRDLLHETWISLTANKGRSILTILGIVIGISSVIAMTSLIAGIRNMLVGELGFSQARMLMIYPGTTMMEDDLEALMAGVPEYEKVAGVCYYWTEVATQTESKGFTMMGVTNDYFDIYGMQLIGGRYFTDEDSRRLERVAIIGRGINMELFGDIEANSIGSSIRLGETQESYTIIGIISGDAISNQYTTIFIPATTLQKRVSGWPGYDSIYGLVYEGSDVYSVRDKTVSFLANYFNLEEDWIYVTSMQEIIDSLNVMMAGFTAILTAIASISLFVGGIGIMNMMLTSVSERTREIGLRRSLGARTSDITQQFLAESIALCLAGGFFGLVFGYLGALALASVISVIMPDTAFTPAIGISSVVIAVIVCVSIGLAFGYYPARRAAKLDPVDSLRYQ